MIDMLELKYRVLPYYVVMNKDSFEALMKEHEILMNICYYATSDDKKQKAWAYGLLHKLGTLSHEAQGD